MNKALADVNNSVGYHVLTHTLAERDKCQLLIECEVIEARSCDIPNDKCLVCYKSVNERPL